ncbi:actin [Entamoeba marina]
MEDIQKPIVLDVGTSYVKACNGHNSDLYVMFPSVVGRRGCQGFYCDRTSKTSYVGDEIEQNIGILTYNNPIENGHIVNWDNMEKIWYHTFYNELRVATDEQALLSTHPFKRTKQEKERITQIMFEVFNVPLLCSKEQETLSLYATGSINGITVQSGGSGSTIVPIIDGNELLQYMEFVDINGSDMNDYLMCSLMKRGYERITKKKKWFVQKQKEELCYVAQDYSSELQIIESRYYKLPDQTKITIDKECISCTESLFNPTIINLNSMGIHNSTIDVINKFNGDLSKLLLNNIMLCGGNAMFEGIQQRFENELKTLTKKPVTTLKMKDNIYKLSTVIGGSILVSLSSFESMCVPKDEYNEYGPFIATIWGI